jgi:hypothetical protein
MAQVAEPLLSNYESQSSNPSSANKYEKTMHNVGGTDENIFKYQWHWKNC